MRPAARKQSHVNGLLPQTCGPHICGPYDAAKNKKPLTSNEISGFWQG